MFSKREATKKVFFLVVLTLSKNNLFLRRAGANSEGVVNWKVAPPFP